MSFESGRAYPVDGLWFPSVTTVTGATISKPALIPWAAKCEREAAITVFDRALVSIHLGESGASDINLGDIRDNIKSMKASDTARNEAAEIGKEAHTAIQTYLEAIRDGRTPPDPVFERPGASYAYASWMKWATSQEFDDILPERRLISKLHKYGGTTDLLAKINGIWTICDWKTSTQMYRKEHQLQLGAYSYACLEEGLPIPERGLIVRSDKQDGEEPEVAEFTGDELADGGHAFLKALDLFNFMNPEFQRIQAKKQAKKDALDG